MVHADDTAKGANESGFHTATIEYAVSLYVCLELGVSELVAGTAISKELAEPGLVDNDLAKPSPLSLVKDLDSYSSVS